ncbi:MAG: YbbR-like domain-containing protein [Myxococcales bacterium]|nr:YbbR-like domain-containing protein [Myxococcales bacterium]MCB9531272.1 YbbR-like domain-containing protein [Myxococcales bacterium]
MRRLLGENPHLKVLALTLTTLLYLFVVGERAAVRSFTLSVRVGHLPPETVVLNELPTIRVNARGSARAFARLDAEALRTVSIDIDDTSQARWEIRESDLGLPSSIAVESITPRWLDLEFDHLETRTLPVRTVVRGTPARGFEASAVTPTPSEILVSAPASYFPDFDAVFTDSVDISGADGPVDRTVGLAIPRPYVTFPDTDQIQVSIEVDAIVETRTLDGVPMLVSGPVAARCSLDVASISVTVTGPKTVVDELEPHEIFAAIECGPLVEQGAGVYTPEPSVKNLPATVRVVETRPSALRLTVSPAPDPTPPPGGSGGGAQ